MGPHNAVPSTWINIFAALIIMSALLGCDSGASVDATSFYAKNAPLLKTPLQSRNNVPHSRAVETLTPTYDALLQAYERHGIKISDALSGTVHPPMILPRDVPRDLDSLTDVAKRQRIFFALVLPAVRAVNATIMQQRAKLLESTNSDADQKWIAATAERYGASPTLKSLKSHIDVVPPALVLAQAAIESAWGTSRFAQQGNALFGEHTQSGATGMKPKGLDENSSIHVESFDTLYDSVASYMMNLNTHQAYADFRAARSQQRHDQSWLESRTLATHLNSYSTRKQDYIDDILTVIDANDLTLLDRPQRQLARQNDD